jgi:ribosomal protein S12 methylthiotransferase accessory factor
MNPFRAEGDDGAELLPDMALERVVPLVSERTGVILSLRRVPRRSDLPRIFQYVAPYSPGRVISHGADPGDAGCGTSLRPGLAKLRAVGEALERYASGVYRTDRLTSAAYRELAARAPCLDPSTLAGTLRRPGSGQADERLSWVEGVDLADGTACFAPAQIVYLPYRLSEGEPAVRAATTSGVAAGTSVWGAVARAALELIEREAFLLTFLHRHRPRAFDLASVDDPLLTSLLDELPFCRLELHVLDITTDLGVPVALAVLIDRTGRYPALNLGAKAAFSTSAAIVGAVEEAFHSVPWGASVLQDRGDEVERIRANPHGLSSLDDRLLYWARPESLRELEFLVTPSGTRSVAPTDRSAASPRARGDALVRHARRVGVRLLGFDLTTPDVLAHGFHVVRVASPQLHPLYLDERDRSFVGDRLFQVPSALGWTEAKLRPDDLNPSPQPFL